MIREFEVVVVGSGGAGISSMSRNYLHREKQFQSLIELSPIDEDGLTSIKIRISLYG